MGGELAQGRHGCLDDPPSAPRAGRSGAKRTTAACPTPNPSGEPATLCPHGIRRLRSLRGGSKGARAPPRTWDGSSAGKAGAPRSSSRRDRRRATAPSCVQALELRACTPRPSPPGGQVCVGAAGPPRPSATWTSTPQICALLGPTISASPYALRHRTERCKRWGVQCATRDTPVTLLWLKAVQGEGDARTDETRSSGRVIGGAGFASRLLRS